MILANDNIGEVLVLGNILQPLLPIVYLFGERFSCIVLPRKWSQPLVRKLATSASRP